MSWDRIGDYLYAANPSQLNNWVQANAGNGTKVEWEFDDLAFQPHIGTNTITAVFEYNNLPQAGDSDSNWMNEADLLGL